MNIAILGKGTSAIVTALTCLRRGHNVEIYYDPNKPHLNVGESTTPHIADRILNTFDICIGDLLNEKIVSLKFGVEFDGWGEGKKFIHYFHSNKAAFHFESSTFNSFIHDILEKKGVKYHAFKIENYDVNLDTEKVIVNGISYDHLICCAGWSSGDEYMSPVFETVNSAFLYSNESFNSKPYTQHLATEHGWQFGLPFPDKNIIKHGYLFNTKHTSLDEARKNINKEDLKYISWEPKYCKKMIQNRFCSYNGNRLMFLEPLQALSLYYYIIFSSYICDFIENKKHENYIKYNQFYYRDVYNYQLSIAWHYSYGSKYNSPFWVDVKKRANELMSIAHRTQPEYYEDALHHDLKYASHEYFSIGSFGHNDYIQINSGMTGKKFELKDVYVNFW